MNIILFPTRFFPAISGGDFYLQRIGETFRKKNKDCIQFLTSNALDFSALHGQGKIIPNSSKFYSNYHNLPIKRFEISSNKKNVEDNVSEPLDELNIDLINSENFQNFTNISARILNLNLFELNEYCSSGPILPEFCADLKKKTSLDKWFSQSQFEIASDSIIHCSYLPYANLIYSLLFSNQYQIRSVVTPFFHFENPRYYSSFLYDLLDKFDRITACTNFEKENFISHGISSTKIAVVPMGVDVRKFSLPLKKPPNLPWHLNEKRILFCGNKNYEKGALTLLSAIPLFESTKFSLSFIFIGSASNAFNFQLAKIKKNLNAKINVINLSPDNLAGVYDPVKISLFQKSDIYCMPSRSDAYGIAYLEAWASKKPVIAADIPAMHEVVNSGNDGLLVPFDDIQALHDVIESLMNDPELCEEMGQKGFEKISKSNSWELISQKTRDLYLK